MLLLAVCNFFSFCGFSSFLGDLKHDHDEPCFICVEKSASRICSSERDHYDCFGLPLSTDAYVPNQRVRALLKLLCGPFTRGRI